MSHGLRYSLRIKRSAERLSRLHWDSLLLVSCANDGVTRLDSEDMQHGADIDGVKIINPFKA